MELELRREAVERAYREHRDDVYRVAYAILRDTEAAVDATHEAFARAFERWEQYDPARPVRAWLHAIVAHEALDAARRQRVRRLAIPALAEVSAAGASGGAGTDPEQIATRRQQVDESLSGLKPAARAALVLRHYYGYDYAEIGTFLGTSPGNVGSILTRAHATLRERIAPGPVPDAVSTEPVRRAAR